MARSHPQKNQDSALVSPTSSAGGLWALGGYFYQFMGSLCRAITTFKEYQDDKGHDGWQVLFSIEDFDQDAVEEIYRNGGHPSSLDIKERRLIQYKFSRKPSDNLISPTELLEIAAALLRSQNQANAVQKAKCKFLVISNRECSKSTLEIIEASKNWNSQKLGQPLHPILDEKNKKTKRRKWSKPVIAVLRQIEWRHESMIEHMAAIKRRAYSLGVLDSEAKDRIDTLIGRYFRDVSNNTLLVKTADIDACLSGVAEGRPLLGSDAQTAMAQSFDNFREAVGSQHHSITRELEPRLREALKRRALIFLYGEGGNGKTTLLERLINPSVLLPRPTGYEGPAFGTVCCASWWTNQWLSQTVANWRGDSRNQHSTEDWNKALQRLRVAVAASHPSARIVLHLGLDAIDEQEGMPSGDWVEALIQQFWQRDRALREGEYPEEVLIVTCRLHPRKILGPHNPWLDSQEMPKGSWFEIPAFSEAELAELVRLAASQKPDTPEMETVKITFSAVATALLQQRDGHLDISSKDFGADEIPLSAQEEFNGAVGIPGACDEYILASLFHPTFWRCFEGLPSQNQMAALQGDSDALREVCRRFVHWFIRKAGARRKRARHEMREDAAEVLHCAAQALACKNHSIGDYQHDWIAPAGIAGLSAEMAHYLYKEALSSGLIMETEKNRWRWKHPFMQGALLNDKFMEEPQ